MTTVLLQGEAADATASALDWIMTLGGNVSHVEFWLWLTLVVLIVEILSAGFFIGALAVSTLVSALSAWLGATRNLQLVTFAIFSIVSLLFIRPLFVKLLSPKPVATNTTSLIGQTGTVIDHVPAGGHGRVRLANEEWRATSNENLAIGEAVRILAVTGNTLSVGKA
ncbi:MAG TPA: NfeD family protein [Planctomycetota bacterium]|nr:NfeD family protein [Planctomycetota bacterium]